MKFICTITIIFCSSILWAQDSLEVDSISDEQADRFQIYLSASYTGQQLVETVASFANVSAGIRYKNKIDLSIYYGVILDSFKKQIIFPTTFSYGQKNFGLQIQYEFTERKIRPLAGLGIQYAQLDWKSEGDLNDIFTDRFMTYNSYLGGSWSINKLLSLQANVGYCWPGAVEIIGLNTEDFQGLNFGLTIKIGVFSF